VHLLSVGEHTIRMLLCHSVAGSAALERPSARPVGDCVPVAMVSILKKTPQMPKRDLDIARVRKADTEQAGKEAQP
jgi:hypothetical protein